jgi:prepilin-type N-terminal cleavage/methylation domain-containing protein
MNRMQRAVARRSRGEEGVTLIELLIVILIMGILAAIIILGIGAFQDTGKSTACTTDARAAEAAWAGYVAKNPNTTPTYNDLVTGKYLVEKGTSYAFTFDSSGQVTNEGTLCS